MGTYRWIGIRVNHEPLNKTTERFYAAYYDVDEYVQGKKKLTEILDNIPGGVAIFSSRNGNIRLEYTNPGFYQLHHGTKEYWSKQSIDPVDWLIPEDRNNFIKEFNEVVQGQEKEGSALYRVTGEDGRLHWVSNQFRPAFKANGFEYSYASFTDMDRVKNGDLEILKTQEMYADATATAKLIVWTYDIKTHLTTMMDVGYTKEICKKLKVPHVIENCPQSLLVYVQEEDRQAFTDAYKSMGQGSDLATCVFGFQLPSQPVMAYERIVLKRINDRDGNLLTAYGYGQNVSEEKLKEERNELANQQLNKAYPDSLGSFHLNLTKN